MIYVMIRCKWYDICYDTM